jgi:hypothetical protein
MHNHNLSVDCSTKLVGNGYIVFTHQRVYKIFFLVFLVHTG